LKIVDGIEDSEPCGRMQVGVEEERRNNTCGELKVYMRLMTKGFIQVESNL